MLDKKKIKDIAIINGIVFKNITVYRAELIHLRNDGLNAKEISNLLNVPTSKIYHYYAGSQPRDEIIAKLERMFFERLFL